MTTSELRSIAQLRTELMTERNRRLRAEAEIGGLRSSNRRLKALVISLKAQIMTAQADAAEQRPNGHDSHA